MKHLGGGLSHTEIWNMPLSLRRLYIKMASDDVKRQNEAIEKQSKSLNPKMPKMPNMRRNMRK